MHVLESTSAPIFSVWVVRRAQVVATKNQTIFCDNLKVIDSDSYGITLEHISGSVAVIQPRTPCVLPRPEEQCLFLVVKEDHDD